MSDSKANALKDNLSGGNKDPLRMEFNVETEEEPHFCTTNDEDDEDGEEETEGRALQGENLEEEDEEESVSTVEIDFPSSASDPEGENDAGDSENSGFILDKNYSADVVNFVDPNPEQFRVFLEQLGTESENKLQNSYEADGDDCDTPPEDNSENVGEQEEEDSDNVVGVSGATNPPRNREIVLTRDNIAAALQKADDNIDREIKIICEEISAATAKEFLSDIIVNSDNDDVNGGQVSITPTNLSTLDDSLSMTFEETQEEDARSSPPAAFSSLESDNILETMEEIPLDDENATVVVNIDNGGLQQDILVSSESGEGGARGVIPLSSQISIVIDDAESLLSEVGENLDGYLLTTCTQIGIAP